MVNRLIVFEVATVSATLLLLLLTYSDVIIGRVSVHRQPDPLPHWGAPHVRAVNAQIAVKRSKGYE